MKGGMVRFRQVFYSYLGQFFMFLLFGTCRWKVEGDEILDLAISEKNLIMLCSWHGRLSYAAWYLRRKKISTWVIASLHNDGDVMARVLKRWGFRLIRGSSKKGGRDVITKMKEAFESDHPIVSITNDGPKGPPRIAKPGSLSVARKYNAKVIGIAGTSSRFWQLSSWDRFRIPKPFSTIYIRISSPMSIPAESSDNPEFESKMVSNFLNRNQDAVDRLVSGS
ncbi:MAG: lysophospholipid acyltransferase family protein [Fidelibacterota bacterium]